jgi:signal transduction histidine kinase
VTIRGRLAIGLAAIAITLLVPLLINMRALESLHQTTLQLRTGEFAASLLLGRLRESADDLRNADTNIGVLANDTAQRQMDSALTLTARLSDSLGAHDLHDAQREVIAALAVLRPAMAKEYEAARTDQHRIADDISTDMVIPAIRRIERAVTSSESTLRQRTEMLVQSASEKTTAAKGVAIISLVGAMLLASLIAIWLTRFISEPVRDLELGMRTVAEGDFSHELNIDATRRDEFGRLAASYQTMTQRLAELDKLRAEFISVASHELKTPVNVIMGYLDLLDEGIYGDLTPKQREVNEILRKQANGLTRLVRRLLDVSRFEAGGGSLDLREINLIRFLNHLESSFQVLASQREITFIIRHEAGLPEHVSWDEDRMNEVLGNLLSNAFKFTQRGGRVDLSVRFHGEAVEIQVKDTGVGIAPEQLPHVFEKFYQADNQESTEAKGTGLGLAIARQIVEAHRGTISVESTVGVGTTFTVTLPVSATNRRLTPVERLRQVV